MAHSTVIAMVSLPAAKTSYRMVVRLSRVILPVDRSSTSASRKSPCVSLDEEASASRRSIMPSRTRKISS